MALSERLPTGPSPAELEAGHLPLRYRYPFDTGGSPLSHRGNPGVNRRISQGWVGRVVGSRSPPAAGEGGSRAGGRRLLRLGRRGEQAFPPLRNWLLTPELQWQSRGQRRISQGWAQGCPLGEGGGRAEGGHLRGQNSAAQRGDGEQPHDGGETAHPGEQAFPFNTGCSPLNYSDNPGVNVGSHWETLGVGGESARESPRGAAGVCGAAREGAAAGERASVSGKGIYILYLIMYYTILYYTIPDISFWQEQKAKALALAMRAASPKRGDGASALPSEGELRKVAQVTHPNPFKTVC